MKKQLPELQSDEEAYDFVATADLTEFDLSEFKMVKFDFQIETKRVNTTSRATSAQHRTID